MKIRISWVGRQSTDVKSTTDINWCSLWEIRYVYHFNISTNLPKHPITVNPIANILLEVYYFNTEVIHRRYFSNRDKLRYTEIYWCPGEIYWDILMPWCSSMMLDGTSVVLVKSQIQGSNQSSQSTVWLELESTGIDSLVDCRQFSIKIWKPRSQGQTKRMMASLEWGDDDDDDIHVCTSQC